MSIHLTRAATLSKHLSNSEDPASRRFATEILSEIDKARFDLYQKMVNVSMAFLEGRNNDAETLVISIKASLATGLH